MPLVAQPLAKFNLSQSTILLVEHSRAEQDLYSQMLFGFGGKNLLRAQTREEAHKALANNQVDLVLVDAQLGPDDEDGYAFVREMRRSGAESAFLPVVLITGHTPSSQVTFARDSGVHFVVRKPVSPGVLLERILWIAQEARAIIECDNYVGPDRRFQRLGPPQGEPGRRADDVPMEVGEPEGPDLHQDEIDAMLQPKKVSR
jgi:CheY-like chemotaxis protein